MSPGKQERTYAAVDRETKFAPAIEDTFGVRDTNLDQLSKKMWRRQYTPTQLRPGFDSVRGLRLRRCIVGERNLEFQNYCMGPKGRAHEPGAIAKMPKQ